jgi:adenylate kinase
MLRERVQSGDELGREVAGIMRSGALVPDELVNRMVEDRITRPDCTDCFILDGYPRTIRQAELLDGVLNTQQIEPLVIHLKVGYDVIIARLAARQQCVQCGTLFNLAYQAPKRPGICDNCGSALVARDDDRESVVLERLKAYERQTSPLLDYFRARGYRVLDIESGIAAPDEIASRICSSVGQKTVNA